MWTKRIISCLLLLACLACDKKQTGEIVTNENIRDVLTRYGAANPENRVTITTDYGTIKLKLYDETPLHRANFVKLIKEGHYEGAEFYRIFYQFMIQAGRPNNQLNYMIPAEFNKKYIHKKGAFSMARQDEDNPELKSSSTEFFIVHGAPYADYQVDTESENLKLTLSPEQRETYIKEGGYMSLDQQYTVFGEVIEGLDVVDKIASAKVYEQDKPMKKIPIEITTSVGDK
jgi:cyclophilin family peptidyl-prolyl cis-trans isomerase